jgi:DNA-binding CsgD family transcriptional regulator
VEPLSESELRVLRYLPTNLTGPESAGELYVSSNTVKTHIRSLYAKLGTHRRAETVTRARDLGLLAPSPPQRLLNAFSRCRGLGDRRQASALERWLGDVEAGFEDRFSRLKRKPCGSLA